MEQRSKLAWARARDLETIESARCHGHQNLD